MARPPQTKNKRPTSSRRKARPAISVRPLHKRLVLHPVTVFFLSVMGVILTSSTAYSRAADTITVTAGIKAAPLTAAAFITAPTENQRFTTSPITVSGTCPPESYVKVYHNDVFSGTARCTDKTFSVVSDLFVGGNRLTARVFNVTDDEGPASPAVNVTYAPPVPVDDTPTTSSDGTATPITSQPVVGSNTPANVPPLVLDSMFAYRGARINTETAWQLRASGGSTPYALHTDWGDGHDSTMVVRSAGDLTIQHTYTATGTYVIRLTLTDASGVTSHLQLFIIVTDQHVAGGVVPPTPTFFGTIQQGVGRWLWLAWPSYITVVLMAFSFWLGEREEYRQLFRKNRLKPNNR